MVSEVLSVGPALRRRWRGPASAPRRVVVVAGCVEAPRCDSCTSCTPLRRGRQTTAWSQGSHRAISVLTTALGWRQRRRPCRPNSVLYGAPITSIQKLQRVQNSLARVVLQQPRMSHARPVLKSLHWLSICQRIQFKVAVLTYTIRSTFRPAYLHSLLSNHVS